MKVKLIFQKSFIEMPLHKDCFAETVDIKLPPNVEQAHLIAAKCYDTNKDTNHLTNDVTATIWDYNDEQRLVGKLLTYIDATYTDQEQRKAHKDIVKDIVYGYCQDLRTRGIQTVDAYED